MTEYILGIEVSGDDLKIAKLVWRANGYKIESLDNVKSDNLNEWVKTNCPQAKKITGYVAIAESLVIPRKIILPKASSKQLENAIHWDVRSNSPIPPEQAIYDYKVIRTTKKEVEILVMIIKSQTAEDLYDLFSEAGIQVLAIEPTSFALSRVIKIDTNQNTFLVTVENEETNFLVLENGYPTFTSSVAVEMAHATENRRRLDTALIQDLALNTQKTIDFWQDKNKKKINQVIISGELSLKYYGLASAIYNLTKIAAFAAKPNDKFPIEKKIPKALIPRFYPAIGAALRQEKTKQTTNFLPLRQKAGLIEAQKEVKTLKYLRIAAYSLLAVVIVAAAVLALAMLKSQDLNQKIDQTQRFVANHPAQSFVPEANKLSFLTEAANSLMHTQKNIGQQLTAINQIKPGNIKLTGIDFTQLENEEFNVQGTGDRTDILQFYDSAVATLSAKEVSMPYSNLQSEKDNKFELLIKWP